MNFLVIDGNSLINRAFYGIKLLSAKDGHYTNAIFGFMNMLMNLLDRTNSQAVAVAFDLKEPTFRHKMFDAYKAGRKPMPPELAEQLAPIKTLIKAFGFHIVECPGYEADDILGTLSANVGRGDHCYLATGDRDSLQLVKDNVTVILPSTKMGQTVTEEYTPQKIMETYGVSPKQMIEIKALQGDSSDNIPGVAGIGPKTAGLLIQAYGDIDNLYSNIDNIDATKNVIEKLKSGRESAFLSRKLGTICLEAPIPKEIDSYLINERDSDKLRSELIRHEMFKLLSKLDLDSDPNVKNESNKSSLSVKISLIGTDDADFLLKQNGSICISAPVTKDDTVYICIESNNELFIVSGKSANTGDFLRKLTEKSKLITFEAKEFFRYCIDNSIPEPDIIFDIKLAGYLLNPNSSEYGVISLAMSYGINMPEIDFTGLQLPEEVTLSAKDVSCCAALKERLYSQLDEREQIPLLTDIEIPLANVLADMEYEGFAIDAKAISDYSQVLSCKIDELQKTIYEAAGEEFNINSPKQLGTVLFDKLGLPSRKKTKTGYSTNADVLEGLAGDYPIVSMILDYRTFSKLKSTYCDGLLKSVSEDGRIHSTFNQTETRTGRLSSTEPNLQNIPVRTAIGREFRKFFIARDGFVLADADYSQIELRVLAALSDDKNMLKCFNDGTDIHTATAAKVFGIPEDQVTSELRSKAKAVNFGIVYGIGAFSLAKDIHTSRAEADSFIKAYLSLYSSVDSYMQRSIKEAKEKGYAQTLFKRRRYLPELTSSNAMLRSFGERVARNMPIQGTAADIIKIAMIKVYKRLKAELPEAKLIMQVHDELIIEAPAMLGNKAAEILKNEMENAVKLSVKLSVDAATGKTWYEAKG